MTVVLTRSCRQAMHDSGHVLNKACVAAAQFCNLVSVMPQVELLQGQIR